MEALVHANDWLYETTNLATSSLLLLLITSFVTSFINATIGVGGGVLMLAVLILVLPPVAVIPVHAVIQLLSNIGRTAAFRTNINIEILRSFAPGCLIGSIAAAFIFVNLPGWLLELVMGLFILSTLIGSPNDNSEYKNRYNYCGVGVFTSFISSFVGATGPLVMAFLHKEGMQKQSLIGTHGACMTIQHFLKLLAFGVVGISITKWGLVVVLLGLTGLAGTFVGRNVLFLLSDKHFINFFKIGLVLLSINILGSAAAGATSELKILLSVNGSAVLSNSLTAYRQTR